jgi:clan AA aspartic protease (TIGR02281 family)
MKIWIATLVLFLALPASAASIFKCKKPEGGFLYQEKPCAAETESVSSWQSRSAAEEESDPGTSTAGNNTFIIGQGHNGHYYVDGSINDHFLNFVIDTGASVVSIPLGMASSAGLRCERRGAVNTANGISGVCWITIQKLTFGTFTFRNIEAMAVPNLSQPLLGMNVLKRFNVEQKNGQMRLTRQY